jgi:hypothetical protein
MIEEKLSKYDVENGEDLTPDDIQNIHMEARNEIRAKMNLNVNTRGKTGEIEDYLETRRPFGYDQTVNKH